MMKNFVDDDDDDDEDVPDLVEVPATATTTTTTTTTKSGNANRRRKKRIPVTLLTGYLGAGKSTLLRHILTQDHGHRIAVIENEFSAGLGLERMIAMNGVDGTPVEGFVELNNGCLCCTVKDTLVTTLETLLKQHQQHRFDYIVIESTGVANPGPVISVFWNDEPEDIDAFDNGNNNNNDDDDDEGEYDEEEDVSLYLDGVVAVVDSYNLLNYFATPDIADDVKTQIAFADRLLLNKSDLVSTSQLELVRKEVRSINALAEIHDTVFSTLNSTDFVLDIHAYNNYNNKGNNNNNSGGSLSSALPYLCVPCDPAPTTTTTTTTTTKTNTLLHTSPSVLGSVSVTVVGWLHPRLLNQFLDQLLYNNGSIHETTSSNSNSNQQQQQQQQKQQHVYRMKGSLALAEARCVHLLQAVHDLFDMQPSSFPISNLFPTTTTTATSVNALPVSTVIAIGRNIDLPALQRGFEACLTTSATTVEEAVCVERKRPLVT